jgi:hypothetical protein
LICGCQELERRARDKYDAFDRVNAELHQLWERCGAFDALAGVPRTPDGWLSYRAVALRDELPESTRQDPARRSSLERVCIALIDCDEALWQARSDLEKMPTLVTNWEAEVASVRGVNRGLRSSLEEADDLKAALDAKVAALAVAEGQLLQERTPAKELRDGSSKSRPSSSTLGRPWSGSALLARWRRWLWRTGTPSSPRSRAS